MNLTPQQLNERKNFIGSSEAKIISSGSYKEWFDLIQEKKDGIARFFDKATIFKMAAGSHLESFVIDNAQEQGFKYALTEEGSGKTVDYMGVPIHSTYDCIARGDRSPVEIKTHFGFMNIDELADLYAPQLQHHMHTYASDHAWLIVFFGLRCRMEFRRILRDDPWIESYLQQCKKFWDWYKDGKEPEDMVSLMPVEWSDMIVMEMPQLECWDSKMQSEMREFASDIIQAKNQNELGENAKLMFKHYMPDNCRKMTFDIGGNLKGHTITMTRSKTNRNITLKHTTPKEERDGKQ